MTLFKKIFLYSTLLIFSLFFIFFLLINSYEAKMTRQQLVQEVKQDIKQFEKVVQKGNMIDISARALFENELIKTVIVSDLLENEIFKVVNESSSSSSFAAMLFTSELENIKVHSKDAAGKNITILATIDKSYLNKIVEEFFYTTLLYCIILFILAQTVLFFILRNLLEPLESIKEQVFHLKENKFKENRKFPKSSDLRELVVMLNETVSNLKAKFKKDTQLLNQYYEVLYHDEQTRLNNRNYFTMHLNSEIEGALDENRGLIIFVKIVNFDSLNQTNGFNHINKALQVLTEALKKLEQPYGVLARIKPDTFAYIISDQKLQESKKVIAKHYDKLYEALNSELQAQKAILAISAGEFTKGDSVKGLLSRVDTALNEATMQPSGKKIAYAKPGQKALSKEERIKLIEYAFANDAFNIELRPIQDLNDDRKNFLKLMVSLKDEKENIYNKDQFLSILHEKGKIAEYDQNIINKICTRYRLINQNITVMINISSEFINSLDHIRWLADTLEQIQTNEHIKLCFSIKDDIVQNQLHKVLEFSKLVYRFNHYIAVGQFTLGKEKLSYLKRLQPRYIVVDQEYVQTLYNEDKSRVKALNFLASETDAYLMVAYMDDPQDLLNMQELKVDYLLNINYKGEY